MLRRIESQKLLNGVKALRLKLGNGTTVRIRLSDEFAAPKNKSSQGLAEELAEQTARLAFFAAQAEIAGQLVHSRQRRYERFRANKAFGFRKFFREETDDYDTREYRLIEDALEGDAEINGRKKKIEDMKFHRDMLIAVREVKKQQVFALGRMLDARAGRRFNER